MEAFTTQILSRAEFEPPTETKFQHRAMIEYVTNFRKYAYTTIHLSQLMITIKQKCLFVMMSGHPKHTYLQVREKKRDKDQSNKRRPSTTKHVSWFPMIPIHECIVNTRR